MRIENEIKIIMMTICQICQNQQQQTQTASVLITHRTTTDG